MQGARAGGGRDLGRGSRRGPGASPEQAGPEANGTKSPRLEARDCRERPEQDLNHYACPVYVAMRPQSSGPPCVLWNVEMKSRRNVDFWLRKGVAAYAVA